MIPVLISGSFDDIRSAQVRFLEAASRLGPVHVLLWSDTIVQAFTGKEPKFSLAERQYFLKAIRFVHQVTPVEELSSADRLPREVIQSPAIWAVPAGMDGPAKSQFCASVGMDYQVVAEDQIPQSTRRQPRRIESSANQKKIVVTGCYDWLHTGHIRFFEEVSQLGALYVVIGSDANVRLLKGDGHPLFLEDERLYMVQSIRYVTEALVSSGTGWMDAEPEIEQIRPDCYVVNEDGDKPEKREYCQARGLDYVVLKRLPKEGLPRRESTQLRGF